MRRTISFMATTAAAMVLTACGTTTSTVGDSSSAPTSTSTTSSTATVKATQSGFTKPAVGGTVDPAQFTRAISNAIRNAKTYRVTLTSAGQKPVSGSFRQVSATRTDFALGNADSEMRMINSQIFMKNPEPVASEKPWMTFGTSDDGSMFGDLMTKSMSGMTSIAGDPMQDELLKQGKVTFTGDETAGSHYQVVIPATALIDMSMKMMESLGDGASVDASEKASMSSEASAGRTKLAGKTITYDYWLGEGNLPNVTAIDMSVLADVLPPRESGQAAADVPAGLGLTNLAKTKTTYSDWGKPVTITAPPASQVQSFDDLMSSAVSDMPTDMPTDPSEWTEDPSATSTTSGG